MNTDKKRQKQVGVQFKTCQTPDHCPSMVGCDGLAAHRHLETSCTVVEVHRSLELLRQMQTHLCCQNNEDANLQVWYGRKRFTLTL